jgi:hypothetical protein
MMQSYAIVRQLENRVQIKTNLNGRANTIRQGHHHRNDITHTLRDPHLKAAVPAKEAINSNAQVNTVAVPIQQEPPHNKVAQHSGGCINWRLIILYLVFQGALSLLTRFGDMPDQANDTDLRTTPPISASSTQFYDEFHQMLMLANESKVFLADSDMCRAKTKQETYVYSENQRSIVSKLEAGTALIVMPSTDVGWVRIWGGASRVYVRTDEVELMNCTESEIVMTSTPIFGSRTMRFVTAVPVTILPVIGQRCYVRNITGDELPVYAWLDTDAEIVGTISTNATFYVEFVRLGWFKVSGATMNQSDGGLVQGVALEVLHCK